MMLMLSLGLYLCGAALMAEFIGASGETLPTPGPWETLILAALWPMIVLASILSKAFKR